MAVSPATLSLNRVAEKARQLFSPVVNTYNQVNTAYQRVNNPPVRQMYNQLQYNLKNPSPQAVQFVNKWQPRVQEVEQKLMRSPAGIPGQMVKGYAGSNLQNTIRAGQGFNQAYTQQSAKPLLGASWNTAKAIAQVSPTSLAKTAPALLAGGIGAGVNALQGKNLAQGFGAGSAEGMSLRPLLAVTNPLTSKTGYKLASTITGKAPSRIVGKITPSYFVAQQGAMRGTGAVGNLIEDEIIAKLEGMKRSGLDRSASLAIGAVMAGNDQMAKNLLKKLSPEAKKMATQAVDLHNQTLSRSLSYVDESGQNRVLRGLTKQDASDWTAYLLSKGIDDFKLDLESGSPGRLGSAPKPPKLKVKPPTDPLEALKVEARKYKSAEEFVKAQGDTLYKGKGGMLDIRHTNLSDYIEKAKKSKPSIESTSYSKLKSQAEEYGKVDEYVVSKKDIMPELEYEKIIDDIVARNKGTFAIPTLWKSERFGKEIAEAVRAKGYKGFEASVSWGKSPEVVLLDNSVVKTKSQLTSLYNQATQPLTKGKIEANQTVIGKTQISPQTKLETPQPLPNVANASPGLMTQAPPKKQLVQLKKQQGKLPLNDQEKVQPQALDNIIAEGRRSIGSAKQEPGRPVKQVLNDLYTQWVDRYHPLSRASRQAKVTLKVKGAELRPEYDPDYLVRRLTGAGGIADQKFNTELKPIIDEVDQLGIPKLDMDTYLAHKRMAGFGDVDREIVGADPIKSKQITTALEAKYPQISGVADKLYKYQDQGLQELVNAGFISPDAVKTIRSQNPDYAPLYRVMDEMDEYLGLPTRKTMQGKNPVVKIKGSKRQIESPVESIIGNTFRQRAAIEKNRVAQSIIGLNKVADMGFNKVAKSGNDTITVWNNGVKEYWQVGTDIADVAKGVNEEVTNTLLKIIQAPAQLLRQGATGRNPAFMIPNVIRDQLDAGITSKYGYIPFVDYVSGLKSMVKNDAIYQKWQNSGAKIDLGELSGKKSVAKLFDEKKSKKRLYQWITAGLDVMGKYSEQPTRVGLFKKAYNKTGNELLSAMESRDATVDFARMGSKMKVANSIIPFLNVGVQGFDKLVRATRNNPKKVLLNMGIYGATPAIAVTAYNLQNFPEEYEEIPQYLKDDNFVIVVGRNAEGVVDYLTIPKGNILPIVTNPIQSFMEYMAGVDSKSFSELATSLVSDTLPVLEGGNTPTEVLVKTTGSMIPQFAKPIIEDITNNSFYKYDAKKEAQGKESGVIVPPYLKSKPPYQQTYDFTPQMYQKIGAVLNVSPLRVKNLMEGYLAGYAKIPSQVVEMMTAISKGESINPNDKTVLSRFIGQTYPTSGGNKPVEKEKSPGLMERATGKVSADDGTSAIPTDQETFNELYKKALSNGTDFPTQKALIEADPTLDDAEKAEKIDKLRTETAQWAETLITMQEKYPEQVFKAELKSYSNSKTFNVEERAEWVAKQLNKATTPEEMRDMLDQMWDAGVLTTDKTGTAQALIDMGINVYAIGNKVGTKSKKAKSSGTKVKKPKKISFTSIKVPKVKLTKVKTFKPPKAKKLRIKKMRKYKIRSMA